MSSAVNYNDYPAYKPFEPEYHAQRPIIVDEDALDSPETVTLRYEEEAAARANGGGLRGDSPHGLIHLSDFQKTPQPPQMNGFDSSRSYADHQYSYPPQQFGAPPPENAAAQLNQMAFAANNATANSYMTPVVPSLISYQPSSGMYGTKVMMKISAPYDLLTVTSGQVSLVFGSHKVPGQAVRDPSDASGFTYAVSGDAPQHQDTRCAGVSVPLSLVIESPQGQALASIDGGTFTYHDTTDVAATTSPHAQDVTRVDGLVAQKSAEDDVSQVPGMQPHHGGGGDKDHHQDPSSADPHHHHHQQQQHHHQLAGDTSAHHTNTPYGYSPAHSMAAAGVPGGYDPNNAYGNPTANTNNMLGTYGHHRPAYGQQDAYSHHGHGHHHARPPPPLKTPSWSPYASLSSRSPALNHTSTIPRPSITTLPVPASSAPALVRTSTLQTSAAGSSGSNGGQYNPYALYSTKAVLKIQGDLQSMASGWTQEEWANRRRIVMFTKKQQGSTLSTNFKPVTISERPPNSICISCIYWAERSECFVTSVDTISLLEQLVASPARFTVEEKNRIRRNLEGFRPLTVSKAKADSEEFFKIIMAFPNPKPRNIEKDVKVFPWKILSSALKKIIGKYSATPSSTMSAGGGHHQAGPSPGGHVGGGGGGSALLTPVSNSSPGLYPPPSHHPPPSSHTPSISDNYGTSGSSHHDSHGGALSSPRSLSGGGGGGTSASAAAAAAANWGAYPASRTLSPNLKSASPQSAVGGMRIPSMPSSYGGGESRHSSSGGHYGMPQPQHHQQHHHQPQSHHSNRWDAVTANGGYGDPTAAAVSTSAYGGAPSSVAPHHHQVYATNGYGERD